MAAALSVTTANDRAFTIEPGLRDPVADSQAIFRTVLDAMAHPGRIMPLPALVAGQDGLSPASVMLCLTLIDHETPLWLDPGLATPSTIAYLRFHAGAPLADAPLAARFAVLDGPSTSLSRFATGSDAYPEDGATVIVQVPHLATSGTLALTGPGIEGEQWLGVEGLSETFWRERDAANGGFPRGLDLILCAGRRIAALPRTTRMSRHQTEGGR